MGWFSFVFIVSYRLLESFFQFNRSIMDLPLVQDFETTVLSVLTFGLTMHFFLEQLNVLHTKNNAHGLNAYSTNPDIPMW